jgi:hypothetical protein
VLRWAVVCIHSLFTSKSSRFVALLLLGHYCHLVVIWAVPASKKLRVLFYPWRFHLPNLCLVIGVTKHPSKLQKALYSADVDRPTFHKW